MSYKLSLKLFSFLFIVLGLAFLILAPNLLQYFGVHSIPDISTQSDEAINFWRVISFARVFGGLIFLLGVTFGFLTYIEGNKNRKLVTSGISVGLVGLVIITLVQQIALWSTLFGWILLSLFALALINFCFLSFKKEVTV